MQTFTIALLDSGVGGLSVLKQITNTLSTPSCNLRLVYLGDTARFPYGERSTKELRYFVAQLASWLSAKGADAIVLACHTASSAAYDVAAACTNVPVYDINRSVIDLASSVNEKTVILATPATVRSGALNRMLQEKNIQADICEIACPDLAPLVESGAAGSRQAEAALQKYADMITKMDAQRVLLACTHFSFLSKQLTELLPSSVSLFDPAVHLSKQFSHLRASTSQSAVSVAYEFYVTGPTESFKDNVARYLGSKPGTVLSVTIEELERSYLSESPARAALA